MTFLVIYLIIAIYFAILTIGTWRNLIYSIFWLPVFVIVLLTTWHLWDIDFEKIESDSI